jgi:hypothetical protein
MRTFLTGVVFGIGLGVVIAYVALTQDQFREDAHPVPPGNISSVGTGNGFPVSNGSIKEPAGDGTLEQSPQ